jgi:hypothetical protein
VCVCVWQEEKRASLPRYVFKEERIREELAKLDAEFAKRLPIASVS